MFNHILEHQFEGTLPIQRQQHVTTDVALFTLEECSLFTAHSFDVAIEIVDNLSSYALNLLNVIDACLFKQALILTVYRFNRSFEYIGLCFWLRNDLWLFNNNLLFLLFLLRYFVLNSSNYRFQFGANLYLKDLLDGLRSAF